LTVLALCDHSAKSMVSKKQKGGDSPTSPAADRGSGSGTGHEVRIVLVEDQPADAALIISYIRRGGIDCSWQRVETEPGLRAALRDFQPKIILADCTLPQFDGLSALSVVQEMASSVPFIFVSGTIGEERAIEALKRGATDFVLKPNLSRLAPAVQRALREASIKAAQRHSEQQLRDTVETSQDWIWETDERGVFNFCSGAVATILGYEPKDLIGKDFRSYLHEDERDRASLLLPPAGRLQLTGAVARWRAANGQLRWLERNVVSIVDESQRVVGYRGADRDITLRREQETRLQRLTRSYRMLSSTNSAILRLRNRADLLAEVCRVAVQQGNYDRVVISLVDRGATLLRPSAWAGSDSASLRALARGDLAKRDSLGVAEQAILTGSPALCNDLTSAQLPLVNKGLILAHGYRAVAALPLRIDGTGIGAVTLFSRYSDVFDEAEVGVLLELSANLSFALQYLEKDEAVQFLSYFDSLTGLAKRPLFCQRLAHLIGTAPSEISTRLVVVFDVQKLGAISDSFGRYVGDRLIEHIAARLKQSYPDSECLAHFGGGTFAVTLTGDDNVGDTGLRLQNAVAQLFNEPFRIDGQELHPAIRSGIALYPHDAHSADTLVQNAETALKAAREANEKYMLYALVTQRPTTRSLGLEARLASALEREEFLLHYQPKIDIASGRVEGLEALLRWRDAQDGLVPPSIFVPLLERSGAIVDVGEWVVLQAVRDLRHWIADGLVNLRVAVNVSPLQLRRRDFVQRMLACIEPSIAPPAGVDIEITESMLMQDIELSVGKLSELREAGINVAIDDFGTGYSSLRLLSKLPVNTLKIDRSFIQDVGDTQGATLVSTIVSLARAFDMTTVAEGVETIEQLQALRLMKCDEAQGYFFARPGPASEVPSVIEGLLHSRSAGRSSDN
jgi:PAS domain S-box-containing protein/diguanylate cyclase (GGDEF)-like protein